MSVLRNLESKLAGLVEGTFGRVFRTEVRPVELARGLAREMDEHRADSLSRTHAPHEYVIHLSAEDHARYAGIESEMASELSGYLLEHARAERLALAATPVITFDCDERLGLGEFGIEALPLRAAPSAPRAEQDVTPAHRRPAPSRQDPRPPRATVAVLGRNFPLTTQGAVIGRSADCDIVIDDANVSRHHAQLAYDLRDGWTIDDLGSTNGVLVNGARITGPAPLRPGDRLDIGTVPAQFESA
ncbi:unannotated protein [freshwater metagenome]|uniref:Unannotated protein n=1 Tax=freshwater metagenome TaxID=449393 RepID=A0A6J7H366_9ZZZZ|nr:DUF3662 domain-containing protein [Actinomycetota bacterium]